MAYHGGPLTAASIGRLEELGEKEIRMEAEFLKHTVAPELRLRHRVVQPDGKYTLPLVPVPMLKASIRSILAPQQAAEGSLDELLENIGFLVLLIYNFS